MRSLAVVTAVTDRWESVVVAGLARTPGVEVVRRCVDLPDLLAVAATGVADVALVSDELRGLDLTAVADLRASGCRLVAVLDPAASEADEARLRQLGITRVVVASAAAAEIAGAVRDAAAADADDADDAEPSGDGRAALLGPVETSRRAAGTDGDLSERPAPVVAVWGTPGAPGRTTVAVTLAAELAATGREVLLVDADTHAASVAPVLGLLDEVAGIAAACRAAEQGSLDVSALARIAPVVDPHLRVLTGLPRADRWTEVRQAALERVLDVARQLVDVVVVDCAASLEDDEELSYDTLAPRRNMATLTAVDGADAVLVVGAADPVGLQRLVRAVDDLRTRGVEPERIVVTKVRRGVLGPRPSEQVEAVLHRYVDRIPTSFVEWGPDVLDAALLAGQSVTSMAPSAPVRVALRGLAAELDPVLADAR